MMLASIQIGRDLNNGATNKTVRRTTTAETKCDNCVRPPVPSMRKHRGGDVLAAIHPNSDPPMHANPVARSSCIHK